MYIYKKKLTEITEIPPLTPARTHVYVRACERTQPQPHAHVTHAHTQLTPNKRDTLYKHPLNELHCVKPNKRDTLYKHPINEIHVYGGKRTRTHTRIEDL